MSQTLKISNYNSINILERTYLKSDYTAGQTVLELENLNNFFNNCKGVIGELGSEQCIMPDFIDIVDTTHINIASALAYDYPKGTPVTALFGNLVKLYRAPNVNGSSPALDTYQWIADIYLDTDDMATSYLDTTGGSDYWYRFTYSDGSSETNLSDSAAVRGGNVGNYCSLDDIREASGFENAPFITDAIISPHRKAAQDYINGALYGIYTLPFTEPINAHIANITKEFAAGYLLLDQHKSRPEIGQGRIDNAQKMLDRLVNKSVLLPDVLGTDTSLPDSKGFKAYPDGNTGFNDGSNSGADRLFRISDIQGYGTRRY